METSKSFAPVASIDAKTLILGSMPGVASLEASQYYAFPRNAFWKIMGELYGAVPELPYGRWLEKLVNNGIALWDVIAACQRQGSLDSNIADAGLVTNDFATFLKQHKAIDRIYFNGQKAATLFSKRVTPTLEKPYMLTSLPSTSPANAGMTYREKLAAWSVIKSDHMRV